MNKPKSSGKASLGGGLNIYGGVTNNEQKNTNKGFGGGTPSMYGGDTSNQQPTKNSNFCVTPNRKAIDYTRGGDKSSNENKKGFKQ